MRLSICVIAYNEETFLPNLFRDISSQEYPHALTEVVLVDSASTDGTKALMEQFAGEDHGFYGVQVLDNPKRIQASGWNVAITHATGDVISRIDAHTCLPSAFSALVMQRILQGEDVVGGPRPCIIENDTPWGRTLLAVENSLFGSSINASRRSKEHSYVKTMFHASYRREVFEKVGLFNEQLLRTEDNEMHYRIRQAGFKLCYDPEIVSYQYARSSLKKMLKQKFANGDWVGRTLKICPGCLSMYHLVPAAFVLGIVVTALLAAFGIWQLAALMWGLYALFAVANTVLSGIQEGFSRYSVLMPVLFLILHVSYGIGTWVGLFTENAGIERG
ncbi:MAG: glycosyltransferase [Oscillospiraceae bacterium]|nr:glycosyltransferase [Oscillospiraceae bacterium]